MFTGFPQTGLDLLDELPDLDREGFQSRRSDYRTGLQEPLKALVETLGPTLRERISPGLRFDPRTNGSIAPVNNDLRFRRDLPTYKDHVLLRFWEGDDRRSAPTLYVRIAVREVGFAAGAAFADLAQWRRAVDADGERLQQAIGELVRATGAEVVGQELKRVPAPWAPDHPQADLLRHKWIQVRWPGALPVSAGEPAFADACAAELERAVEVHRWLVEHLT